MTAWPSRSILACILVLSACPGDPAPQPSEESSTGPSDTSTSSGPGPTTTPEPTSSTSSGADTTAGSTGPVATTSTGPDDTTGDSTTGDASTGDSTTGASTSGSTTDASTGGSTGGSTTGGDPCAAGDGPDFAVTNNGFTDYVIDGVNDPPLVVVRGCSYTFNVNAPGHPFLIKSVQGAGLMNTYDDGVVGNGTQNGAITWDVSLAAPDSLFYNCQFHAGMTGTIMVIDPM